MDSAETFALGSVVGLQVELVVASFVACTCDRRQAMRLEPKEIKFFRTLIGLMHQNMRKRQKKPAFFSHFDTEKIRAFKPPNTIPQ